jgi:hypothetical protein
MDELSHSNTFPVPSFPFEAERMAAGAPEVSAPLPLGMLFIAQDMCAAGLAGCVTVQRAWLTAMSDWSRFGWPGLQGGQAVAHRAPGSGQTCADHGQAPASAPGAGGSVTALES